MQTNTIEARIESSRRLKGLPRVTILTANAGGGHRAAARSLAESLEGQAHISYLSLMDDHLPFPINTWSATYGPWVNYTPWLYRLVYQYGSSRERVLATERAVYPLLRKKIAKVLVAERADLFISVHPLHTDVPLWSLAEAGCHVPFVTVVTDPVTPPVAWFAPGSDICVVATPPAQATALACGLDPHRVRVIGLPIRKAFLEARGRSKAQVRAQLGLEPDRSLVLISGGGAGIGNLLPMTRAVSRRLGALDDPPQVAIITGRNVDLYRRLRRQRWRMPTQVLGFVENMADWLAAADLLVSKAGPGTLAEAACLGVPALITDYVPGQEIGNVQWVERHGAGLFEREPPAIAGLIAELLRPGNPTLELMSQRAFAMARPTASDEIAAEALKLVL